MVEDLHTNYWTEFIDSKNTFVEYAKEHIDALNACFFNSNDRYRSLEGKDNLEVPLFTCITDSISFYNSIIVFTKKRNSIPLSEEDKIG